MNMLLTNQLESVSLGTLNIFCVAAAHESFVTTAELLGLTPATVSRCISRLEKRLGVKLFARTTRQVKLTQEGKAYYHACFTSIQQIHDAENDLISKNKTPKGQLKISLPTTYAYYRLMPALVAFQTQYSQITLDIDFSNTNIDFVAQGFDISVRMGEPKDNRLVAKKLEDAHLGVYATPAYLRQHGTPQNLTELTQHTCIQFIMPHTGRALPWQFKVDKQDVEFIPQQPIYISGDVLGAIRYANASGGVFQTYDFIAQHIENANLIEILQAYRGQSRPFHLIYPYSKYLPNKMRVFIDFVLAYIKNG